MVKTGLLQFNNQHESYKAVSYTFQSCTKRLDFRHRKEIDLLIEWLSIEFIKHSIGIMAVYLNHLERELGIM